MRGKSRDHGELSTAPRQKHPLRLDQIDRRGSRMQPQTRGLDRGEQAAADNPLGALLDQGQQLREPLFENCGGRPEQG